MLRTANLTKRYGATLALDRLSFSLPDGSITGLVGPNGSGKSTLFKLLMGLIRPDSGSIDLDGIARTRIGYMPDRPFLPTRLTCREYLSLVAELCGLEGPHRQAEVAARLDGVGLTDATGKRISALSKGMVQRLSLAAALVNDPPLLLLDEPMGGLDPGQQAELRSVIQAAHGQGKTILLSTHRLSEVSDFCTQVAILKQGRLVRSGSLADVLAARREIAITIDRLPIQLRDLLCARYPGLLIRDHTLTLVDASLDQKNEVLRMLIENGCDIRQLGPVHDDLEEIYLEAVR